MLDTNDQESAAADSILADVHTHIAVPHEIAVVSERSDNIQAAQVASVLVRSLVIVIALTSTLVHKRSFGIA